MKRIGGRGEQFNLWDGTVHGSRVFYTCLQRLHFGFQLCHLRKEVSMFLRGAHQTRRVRRT
jgi:hypothetical protein